MISLDNDAFLHSLESMMNINPWADPAAPTSRFWHTPNGVTSARARPRDVIRASARIASARDAPPPPRTRAPPLKLAAASSAFQRWSLANSSCGPSTPLMGQQRASSVDCEAATPAPPAPVATGSLLRNEDLALSYTSLPKPSTPRTNWKLVHAIHTSQQSINRSSLNRSAVASHDYANIAANRNSLAVGSSRHDSLSSNIQSEAGNRPGAAFSMPSIALTDRSASANQRGGRAAMPLTTWVESRMQTTIVWISK